jgi:rhodanese-related sulfurtransferase
MSDSPAEVTPQDAARRTPDTLLIDVREPIEWAAGHAPDATHIPLGDLHADSLPAGARVMFICRTGSRSGMATTAFRRVGVNASNVVGGMFAWSSAGLPVVRDDNAVATVL